MTTARTGGTTTMTKLKKEKKKKKLKLVNQVNEQKSFDLSSSVSKTYLLEDVGYWGCADILGVDLTVNTYGEMQCKFRPAHSPMEYCLTYYDTLRDCAYVVFSMGTTGALLVASDATRYIETKQALVAFAPLDTMRKAIAGYKEVCEEKGMVFDETFDGLRDYLYIHCPRVMLLNESGEWDQMKVIANG
jgi:hypothetical protein